MGIRINFALCALVVFMHSSNIRDKFHKTSLIVSPDDESGILWVSDHYAVSAAVSTAASVEISSERSTGENTTVPNTSTSALSPTKALNRSEVATSTTPISSSTGPVSHNSTTTTPISSSTGPVSHNSTTTTPISSSTGPVSHNSSQVNSTVSPPLSERATTNISKDSNVTGSTASTPLSTRHDDTLTNRTPTELPVTTGSVGPSVLANGTSRPLTSSPEPSIPSTANRLNISSPVPVDTTSNASVALSSRPSPTLPANVPTTTGTPKTSSTVSEENHNSSRSSTEVNVEDEESTSRKSGGTLDPLLAGLVTFFIVSAAIASLLLFLKFRKRNAGPEFRRLQDLPMDDMMEDTPLSMFSY